MPRFEPSLRRRSAIIVSLSTIALSLLPLRALGISGKDPSKLDCRAAQLLGLFEDLNAPATIGRRYLEVYREEGDPAWLCDRLLHKLSLSSAKDLRAALVSCIQLDFCRRDVAIVDGWVLSRTEAQVCALASLVEASAS